MQDFTRKIKQLWLRLWVLELFLHCSDTWRAPAMGLIWVSWSFVEYFRSTVWKLGPADSLDEATLLWSPKELTSMNVGHLVCFLCTVAHGKLLAALWGNTRAVYFEMKKLGISLPFMAQHWDINTVGYLDGSFSYWMKVILLMKRQNRISRHDSPWHPEVK